MNQNTLEHLLKGLLKSHIGLALDLSGYLSKNPEDKFDQCAELLCEAMNILDKIRAD